MLGAGYTCCPKNTKCVNHGGGYSVVSHCVASDANNATLAAAVLSPPPLHVVGATDHGACTDATAPGCVGAEVCKTGPPNPYSTSLKNVLVVGDSVSIGYTPFIAKVMEATALVQHSPWGGDGGAEETKYGAACIDNLVRAPDGTTLSPDVLMFNWGLHNSLAGNCTAPCVPGQSGPPAEYAPYLEKIVAGLLAAPALKKTKLLFAITSPDLCNAPIDHIQAELNAQAAAIMAKNKIPIVDLYKAITTKCGAVPQVRSLTNLPGIIRHERSAGRSDDIGRRVLL